MECCQHRQRERCQNGGGRSSWRDIRSRCPSPSPKLKTNQLEHSRSPPMFLISENDTIIYPIVQLKNPSIIFDFSLKASPPTSCWLCLQKTPNPALPSPLLASSTSGGDWGVAICLVSLLHPGPLPYYQSSNEHPERYFLKNQEGREPLKTHKL